MVDPIRINRSATKEVRKELERQEVIEALRHGNIYEIFKNLPANVTREDIQKFIRDQNLTYLSQIVQPEISYAQHADHHGVNPADFPEQDASMRLHAEEGQLFVQSFSASLGKAAVTKGDGAGASGADGRPLSHDELTGMAHGTLDEFEQFMSETMGTILDAQMMADYKQRMGEVQKEAERLIALAKQGIVNPEFVLIALAKVNATKSGVLMTWLGKKAFNVNEALTHISDDLRGAAGTQFANLEAAREKTREGGFQLQMLVSDMQKVMQDVASVLEQVNGMMGEMNRTRREIITKVAAQ